MKKKKKYTVPSVGLSTMGSALVAIIFSSLFIFSLGTIFQATGWLVAMQALSLLIFIPMVYSPSWYCGDHDANAVSFGRMEEKRNKGFFIGLFGSIPFALTPLLLVLTKLGVVPIDLGPVYRMVNVHMLYAINALLSPDVPTREASWAAILLVWAYHLILPLTTFVAYRLGYKHISISERLIFKNIKGGKKKNPRRR